MSQWFRFYSEALEDPKVQKLSDALFKTWVNILCLAARCEGLLPAIADMAFSLRLAEKEMASRIKALITCGLLDDVDGGIWPHNWNARQFKSDVSTDRVKRHRERFKPPNETLRNPHKKRSRNGGETASETTPEAETETDTEAERAALLSSVSTVAPRDQTLEQRCRKLVGEEPVSADPAFVLIGDLVGTEGIIEADLIAAVMDAMAKPGFRIKYWESLINWVRKAAQKRLAAAPKINGHANGATSDDPEVDLGPVKDRQSKIVNAIQKIGWAGYAGWAETEFGSVEYFRSAVSERAPHLLKFWPSPPATDPAEPAKAVAK